MDRTRRDSTLIIYLSPSVRVSHIDPLSRVKCNAVLLRHIRDVAAGRTYTPDALLSAEERVESIDRPIHRLDPSLPRPPSLLARTPADVNTCSRRYSHGRIDFLTRLLRVINPTRGRRAR